VLVRQVCSVVTVSLDDEAVAEFFDQQIDLGRKPQDFARIWIHSHPGNSAEPSGVDEETFARVFGRSDWAVMAIIARGGQTYARLQFHTGPGGALRLKMDVDFQTPFGASDPAAWTREYQTCVTAEPDLRFFEETYCRPVPSAEEPLFSDWFESEPLAQFRSE